MSDSYEQITKEMCSALIECEEGRSDLMNVYYVNEWSTRLAALSGQAAQTAAPDCSNFVASYFGIDRADIESCKRVGGTDDHPLFAVTFTNCSLEPAPPASKQSGEFIDFKDGTTI